MKIKRILLFALAIALPIFSWYLLRNKEVLELIAQDLKQRKVIPAFIFSSLIILTAHVVRAYKTKTLTDNIKHTSLRTHTRALFIGYLFNILLPLRLGELIRAIVLGKGTKMSATFMFGLVLLDRAIDGFILSIIALFLIRIVPAFNSSQIYRMTLTGAFVLILLSTFVLVGLLIIRRQPPWLLSFWHKFTRLLNNELRDSLRFKAWSLMYGLERVFKPSILRRYIFLSICMWALYIIAIFPIASVFFSSPTLGNLSAISTVSYLGISAPAGPSHIGSYENFVQPYIDSFPGSIGLESALIFTWLLQVIPAFIVGLIFVLRTNETIDKPEESKSLQVVDNKLLRDVDITHDLGSFLDAFFTNNSLSRIMHRFEVDKDSKLIHYFKGGSSAITALVHENDSFIVRKITPIQYKYKLKSQFDWLKDKQKLDKVVNVLSEETTDSYYKIDLEYNKDYIPLFDYIHSMPNIKSKRILTDVFNYLDKNIYKPEKIKYRPKDLKAYIDTRCLGKIRQASEVNDEIRSLLTYDKICINGQEYTNIPLILNEIKKDKKIAKILATYRRCSIHGDTTIDNILADKSSNKFLLIDPTDNENEISGPVFDFGRMTQSLRYGYEFLNRDDQKVQVFENRVDFEYTISNNYALLAKHLEKLQKKYLEPVEQQAVLFHTALLYSRMLTHRVVINPLNAVKYYAISVIAFNDFMKQIRK